MMHSATTSGWVPIIGSLGIGSFIGTLLSLLFTARQQHKSWLNQNRAAEYRQLLDALYDTVSVVTTNRPNLTAVSLGPINDAVKKLSRIFEDRLFVADSLKSANAIQDWYDMKKVIYYQPDLQSEINKEFWYSTDNLWEREDKLRAKILSVARKDIVEFKV